MIDYKRITRREEDGTTWVKCVRCDNVDICDYTKESCCQVLQDRLAELEDLIEQGLLVQLDENLIGAEVIGIQKCTDGTYYPDLFDENIVIGFTSKGVVTWNNSHGFNDYFENGYYFHNTEKGRAEAEAMLEELTGGDK